MLLRQILDKNNEEYKLYDEVWSHITRFHPEIKDIETIENILNNPDFIVKSNWDETSKLYYKQYKKLYKVVVVETKEKRIKTTLTTDKIKKGEILWTKK